jgi:hypothetical protein
MIVVPTNEGLRVSAPPPDPAPVTATAPSSGASPAPAKIRRLVVFTGR